MNYRTLLMCVILGEAALVPCLRGQDTVVVPRSRLEELERKEAELEKLRSQFKKVSGETLPPKKQAEAKPAKPAVPAPPPEVSTPLRSLPKLSEGEMVEARDLSEHYRTDVTGADARYRKRTFRVKGEVAGFEVPPFLSYYKMVLRASDPQMRVVCEIPRPEKYKAVNKTENGSQLVGVMVDGTRVPLVKTGEMVVVEGRCNGSKDSVVSLSRCKLKTADGR